ncbi:MAG TPA: FkbM family methyltransferase, partial [Amaricoccus sp.]|nr:FkbM family methyltransferase [Amaricoccus sp.]
MTIEQKIDETPTAAARGPAGKIAEFLADIEPFFYRVPITYVDVGAHHGDIFRELAASGLHLHEAHLVEPSPTAFAALEATARGLDAPGTRCHRLALAEAPGAAAAAGAPGAEAGTFEVESTTLDALARTFAAPRISLLKIDVEGYEPQVLAGAAGLLAARAIDMIYVEAGMNPDGRQQAYYRDIEDLLRGHGYRLFRIYEQMHEWLDDSPLLRRVNLAFMSADFAQRHPFRLSRELAALRRDRAGLRAALMAEQTARAEAEAGLAEAGAAAARQAASLEARFAELAALTALLERQKAELAAATAARGTAESAHAAAEAAAATARGNAEAGRAARRKAEVEARRRAEAERAEASAARRQAEAALAEASAGRRRA